MVGEAAVVEVEGGGVVRGKRQGRDRGRSLLKVMWC